MGLNCSKCCQAEDEASLETRLNVHKKNTTQIKDLKNSAQLSPYQKIQLVKEFKDNTRKMRAVLRLQSFARGHLAR